VVWRWGDLENEWHDLTETSVSAGSSVPTVGIAYDGEQPIAIIEGPPFCLENADQTIDVLDRAFTPLRPDRVAVGWQAIYTVEAEAFEQFASEDGLIHGVQLTRGIRSEPGTIRWWTTTLFYRRFGGHLTDWSGDQEAWDVDEVANPYPRRLMCMLADERDERLQVSPYLEVPGEPYLTAFHPDLVAELEAVDEVGPVRAHGSCPGRGADRRCSRSRRRRR